MSSIVAKSMEEIIELLATWIRGDHAVKVAAVQLPMGMDSAAVVRVAVERAGAEPVWLSMGGVAGVDVASAARSPMAVTFKKKVIVVDEFDAIVASDPATSAAIGAAIKVNRVPVVLVANSFRSKAAELPRGHAAFALKDGPPPEVRAIFAAPPDSLRDKGLDGAEAALAGVRQDYRGDGIALGGVFDNYPACAPAFDQIAEAFSSADVISEGMCRAGHFDDPYSFLPVAVAAWACRDGPTHPPRIATFGTVWSKTNAMYAKVNGARAVSKAIRESGSRTEWAPVGGLDFARSMVASAIARDDVPGAAAVARAVGVQAAGLLTIMRLWKAKYTLATHGKVKKLL